MTPPWPAELTQDEIRVMAQRLALDHGVSVGALFTTLALGLTGNVYRRVDVKA